MSGIHGDEFVFIHINKTGGTSIERALGIPLEHKTALEKILELGWHTWQRRFTFTIIRNPWDRVVSHYHYRVQTNQTSLGTKPIRFAEWVMRAYGERDPFYHDKPKMFMPQLDWITDEGGRNLVEFVGRFEDLEKHFRAICQRLHRQAILPQLKKSRHLHYRDYYDTDSKKVVATCFQKDIERFEYHF